MELTPHERHIILHSLGLPGRRWAYRNYYAACAQTLNADLEGLCTKGYMRCYLVNQGGMTWYTVTRAGVEAVGVVKYVPKTLVKT